MAAIEDALASIGEELPPAGASSAPRTRSGSLRETLASAVQPGETVTPH
jgi:hypothetical protein